MQDRPVCFECIEPIEKNSDMVFESLCGCEGAPSAVFHAICLFEWRDKRKTIAEHIREMRERWEAEHREADDA